MNNVVESDLIWIYQVFEFSGRLPPMTGAGVSTAAPGSIALPSARLYTRKAELNRRELV